jgi:hypothetical protein
MRAKRSWLDERREERITMEIIVDAYGPEEQAMSWYYYLDNHLHFPFSATCTKKRAVSPLQVTDKVDVIGLPPEDECEREMFVTIRWEKDGLAVPLSQLKLIFFPPSKGALGDLTIQVNTGSYLRGED